MFQESEIINLALGAFSVLMVYFILRGAGLSRLRMMIAGFAFMLGAYLFTVLEGVIFYGLFNTLEHMCYALSGVFIAVGCRSLFKDEGGKTA